MRQRFRSVGLSAEFADAYMALLAETLDRPALVTHEVEKSSAARLDVLAVGGRAPKPVHQSGREKHMSTSNPRPPRFLKAMNKLVIAMQRLGIPAGPSMVLTVPGRKSGQPRSTPMTPFDHDGGLYTVAGYPGADWAANARAAGLGTLSRGRRSQRVRI